MLVQMDALYPDGVPFGEHSPEEDNDGWRCVDTTGPPDVFSLEDLPPGFIENLEPDDSGNSYLFISSAVKTKGNDERNGNSWLANASATSNNEKNTIKISPGATISISRGNMKNRDLQEGRRLASAPGDPEGDHTLLVVRVTGTDSAPSQSAADLSDDIFGTYGDKHNLVSISATTTSTLTLSS